MKKVLRFIQRSFFSEGSYNLRISRQKGTEALFRKKTYSIVTWNLGYCNLGKESSWVFSGGKRFITATKEEVIKNIAGIIKKNKKMDANIYLFQEISGRSITTYYSNAYRKITLSLKKFSSAFAPKIAIRSILIPASIGSATMTRFQSSHTFVEALPDEPSFIFRKQLKHHMLITEYSIEKSSKKLFTINIHLPAYDTKALVRKQHVALIQEKAQELYKAGHYVLCGGDWNLLFCPQSSFAYTTKPERIRHVFCFPEPFKIPEWQWAYDSSTPTLRELDGPYKKGENFTGVVDGFFVSPNIKVKKTTTLDYGFEFSDHNPVLTQFELL